jgi:hypothetical protein
MTITLTREEAQQVLDALNGGGWTVKDYAVELLRARLAQPEREWQGLTDEELLADGDSVVHSYDGLVQFARAIEAKLKEKNT